ncbi:MAG: DJ-1/PfpI family protein, partial [Firmicutes bacterium]|nr:DJ-1/PfpI family protein [Bacillota bacterium]
GSCVSKAVCGAHGISVNADIMFEEADFDSCEMIVLPGGMPGTLNLAKHEGLAEQVKQFAVGAADGKYLAAICAAPMIPGELGLLDGKMATIYPGMEEHLKGALIMKNRVVADGNIITSKGPGTAMEFAVELAAILKGKGIAEDLMEDLLMGR